MKLAPFVLILSKLHVQTALSGRACVILSFDFRFKSRAYAQTPPNYRTPLAIPQSVLSLLLKPLSKLFAKIAVKRRDDFVSGRLKSEKLPVPVVVVGNIHAGRNRENADSRRAGVGFARKGR